MNPDTSEDEELAQDHQRFLYSQYSSDSDEGTATAVRNSQLDADAAFAQRLQAEEYSRTSLAVPSHPYFSSKQHTTHGNFVGNHRQSVMPTLLHIYKPKKSTNRDERPDDNVRQLIDLFFRAHRMHLDRNNRQAMVLIQWSTCLPTSSSRSLLLTITPVAIVFLGAV
jgi:hypothetical protein